MIADARSSATPALPEITAEFDRSIVNIEGASVRHLVITVRAPALPESTEPRVPLNLGVVIDASGSMRGLPLEAAKAATLALLQRLAESDHFSLVSFASDVVTHTTPIRLDVGGRKLVTEAIRPLATRGNTNLFAGWIAGCQAVAARQAAAPTLERNHVILLSDGHANEGECRPAELARHAGELRKRGVNSSTVGVGCTYSPIQLQAIAEAGGGRMHDAEEPDEIAEIMYAELNDALTTSVENLEICLRLPRGVQAELYGSAPVNHDAEGCEILAGSLGSGTVRRLAVKLTFPGGTTGERLPIGITARWRHPDGASGSLDVGGASVRFDSAEACARQPRRSELVIFVADLWKAQILRRAMILNQDGAFARAIEFVNREVRFFEAYAGDIAELEASVRELRSFGPSLQCRYSALSSKEVFLQSYKSSRGEVDHRSRKRQSTAGFISDEMARQRSR